MARKPSTKKERAEAVEEALGYLREQLPTSVCLYFVCVYHSRRGYSTHGYRIFVAENDADRGSYVRDITWLVGRATETYRYQTEDIRITGCGFSKPQQVVDLLRHRLGGDYNEHGYDSDKRRYKGVSYTM